MSTIDASAFSNGRGSDAWARSWTHLGIDRRSPSYFRVSFDHPPINTITAANPAGSPASVYLTGGTLPAAGTPNATVFCSTTCVRPWDTANHPTPGGPAGWSFAFGLAVGPSGELVITEDPSAGNRSGRGTMWVAPFVG